MEGQASSGGHAKVPQPVTFDQTRHFVGRSKELDRIRRDIQQIQTVPVQKPVLNIIGVPGIGKSAFFEYVYQEQRHTARVIVIGCRIDRTRPEHIRSDLVAAIRRQLPEALQSELSAAATDLAGLAPLIGEIGRQMPVVLMVDGCEYLAADDLLWLESDLLRRLLTDSRIICLLSSQAELRWRSFELRRRTDILELKALSVAETHEQIGHEPPPQAADATSDELYALTAGYPLANEWVYRDPANDDVLGEVAQELRRRIVTDVPEEVWTVLQVTALLREFDLELLQALLPQVDAIWKDLTQAMVSELIRRLVATRLCRPDAVIPAYKLIHPIRPILASDYTKNNPKKAHLIHVSAARIYRERLRTVPRSRNRYLIEYCYHWAIYNPSGQPYNADDLGNQFDKLITMHYSSADGSYVDAEGLRELADLLWSDAELQRVFQERGLHTALLESIVHTHLTRER